ncbi:unnamed protein product [Lathyrus sativus]|nr:unnamed protein product [Lathyrus sativus]
MWKDVIEIMRRRLADWKGNNLSIGGRVVLINSIQSHFLWGSCSSRKKIHWVDWKSVCAPKVKGGLGIKDISYFNGSLLLKWKWRFLNSKGMVWKGIINNRYAKNVLGLAIIGYDGFKGEISSRGRSDLFVDSLKCSLGNGKKAAFWHCKWIP